MVSLIRVRLLVTAAITSLLVAVSPAAAEELADAAERGAWDRVSSLGQTADVNASQPDGTTALHWAAQAERPDVIASLLAAGADASVANGYGVTPLELACAAGDAESARLLLSRGADATVVRETGRTMPMTAARSGAVDVLTLLLSHSAHVDATERSGQTALMWAAAAGHADAVQTLLDAGAIVDRRTGGENGKGFTALMFAAREGRQDVCERLLDAGADIHQTIDPKRTGERNPRPQMSPLLFAVESGHFELALALVARGADPDDQRSGYAPLHALTWVRRANKGDNPEGDPEPRGSGAVSSLEFARRLVAAGATVDLPLENGRGGKAVLNVKGATPLLLASHTADLPYMETLLQLGADPDARNVDRTSTLAAAAGVGVVSLVDEDPGTEPEVIAAIRRLAALGVSLDEVDANGETAMHGAAYRNYPEAVRVLDELGATPAIWNQKNKHGWTPREIAAGKRPGSFKPSPPTIVALDEVLARTEAPLASE